MTSRMFWSPPQPEPGIDAAIVIFCACVIVAAIGGAL